MDVRAATIVDLDGVVTVLTAAFHDDPMMTWAFPDDDVRPLRLAALWRFMAGEAYIPRGGSTIVPGPDAAALWLAPGEALDREFWATRWAGFVASLEGDVDRMSRIGEVTAAHHPHDREHWYLLGLGVAPARQGLRLGSALLAHTLDRADAAGAPAYLEATGPRNRALYERLGFETLAELAVDDSPTLWPMWREPA
jgi:ribosomal protein S18 acetylase RimI-like enzyme